MTYEQASAFFDRSVRETVPDAPSPVPPDFQPSLETCRRFNRLLQEGMTPYLGNGFVWVQSMTKADVLRQLPLKKSDDAR
jgi:hypothetical protein